MKIRTMISFGMLALFLAGVAGRADAQHKESMGFKWEDPTSGSIGKILNDRLLTRIRAKARARDRSRAPAQVKTIRTAPPPADPQLPEKPQSQIDAAVRFRATGTQLKTQAFVDLLTVGGTPETKQAISALISTLLTEYEKAARAQGKPNDLALAVTAALVYNSCIYNGTPEPDDARIMEIRDAMAELAVEAGTFALMNDRQRQELYEDLVISTLLAKVGYEEGQKNGDTAAMTSYRNMAGQNLTTITGLPPEKINFTADINATIDTGPAAIGPATLPDSEFMDFDPFPDKPYVQPQKPLIGRLRKAITMADLAGNWELGGASVTSYFNSGNYSSTDTSFFGEKYTIHPDGTFTSKFQGRTSNTTIRESDSGNIILSGGFVIVQGKQKPTMRYQFVAYMSQPNGSAVLSLIYVGDNPPLDIEALRANCGHANGYVSCINGEEWVRVP